MGLIYTNGKVSCHPNQMLNVPNGRLVSTPDHPFQFGQKSDKPQLPAFGLPSGYDGVTGMAETKAELYQTRAQDIKPVVGGFYEGGDCPAAETFAPSKPPLGTRISNWFGDFFSRLGLTRRSLPCGEH